MKWNGSVKISMRPDFPTEINQRRQNLFSVMIAAKNHPAYKGEEIYLAKDKIIIGRRRYGVDNLSELPEELQPGMIAPRTNDEMVLFWGRDSYLSNYSSPFWLDGKRYKSVEECICVKKCEIFGERNMIEKIRKEHDTAKQKELSRSVSNFDPKIWYASIKDITMSALQAKFEQNTDLKETLIQSRGKLIAEMSAKDKKWGTGLGLYHKDAFNKEKWVGENFLGQCLMEVCDSF